MAKYFNKVPVESSTVKQCRVRRDTVTEDSSATVLSL